MTTIPAAAVRAGDLVDVDGDQVRVLRVHNSDPGPGRIRWELAADADRARRDLGVSARHRVELLDEPTA